jgi:4-hydroxy-2-oxoheptanedioate aldolase
MPANDENVKTGTMKTLKERIQSGETVHGSWLNLGSNISAEIMGHAGFDWLLIDMEHGTGNDEMMIHQLQVLASTNVTPLVRTGEASRSKIQQILDSGAQGVMFPQIQNFEEAQAAIKMMYYPPKGTRGMAKIVRTTNFGKTFNEYFSEMEKRLIGLVQIETANAVKEIDQIASIDGADVLFVGPTDLSVALGTFNQPQHPMFQKALRDVVAAANQHKKVAGILIQDMADYVMYSELGFRFIGCGGDSYFIMKGANEVAANMKSKLKS